MKTSRTFSILFWLKKSEIDLSLPNHEHKAPIYARVTVDGKRAEISIKRSIHSDSWNPKKEWPKAPKKKPGNLMIILNKYG